MKIRRLKETQMRWRVNVGTSQFTTEALPPRTLGRGAAAAREHDSEFLEVPRASKQGRAANLRANTAAQHYVTQGEEPKCRPKEATGHVVHSGRGSGGKGAWLHLPIRPGRACSRATPLEPRGTRVRLARRSLLRDLSPQHGCALGTSEVLETR